MLQYATERDTFPLLAFDVAADRVLCGLNMATSSPAPIATVHIHPAMMSLDTAR